MSKYFIKNFEWLFTQGKDGMELYNVNDKKNFVHLNCKETDIFMQLFHGRPKEEFEANPILSRVLQVIEQNGIGEFKENYYINPEYKVGKEGIGYFEHPAVLGRVFFEIPSECNKCENCEKILSARCYSCHKTKSSRNIEIDEYKNIIDGLKENNCHEILLHGADILNEKLTYELINYIQKQLIYVTLIVHNNMLNRDKIRKIMSLGQEYITLVVNFDILNENDIEIVYDKINHIYEEIGLEKNKFNVSLRIGKSIFKVIADIKNHIEDTGVRVRNVSVFSDEKITKDELNSIYLLNGYDYNIVKNMKQYNICLTGTLSFDTELNVLVCPHMRKYVIRTNEGKLNDENTLRGLWGLSRSKIEQCSSCSKRYRCLDCREIETFFTDKLNGKRICEYYNDTAKIKK